MQNERYREKFSKPYSRKDFCTQISIFGIVSLFIISSVNASPIPSQDTSPPDTGRNIVWDVTLSFTETSGKNDYIIFGEAPDASDGNDIYDTPNPPSGPGVILDAYLTTSFPWPYNKLLQETKKHPDTYKIWNFTVRWTGSNTTVTISWDTSEFAGCEYNSAILYDVDSNSVVANMLVNTSYTFMYQVDSYSNYKIMCSVNNPPDTPAKPYGPPIALGWTFKRYTFYTNTTDPNGDWVQYGWDWDNDDMVDNWTDFYDSGETVSTDHLWMLPDIYYVKVKAKDIFGAESDWSEPKMMGIYRGPIAIKRIPWPWSPP